MSETNEQATAAPEAPPSVPPDAPPVGEESDTIRTAREWVRLGAMSAISAAEWAKLNDPNIAESAEELTMIIS